MKKSGGFSKMGVPQNGWFVREHPIEVDDDLGVPLWLRKPPNMDETPLVSSIADLGLAENRVLPNPSGSTSLLKCLWKWGIPDFQTYPRWWENCDQPRHLLAKACKNHCFNCKFSHQSIRPFQQQNTRETWKLPTFQLQSGQWIDFSTEGSMCFDISCTPL